MRNLENFRQAVESPKSWNLMGCFCPKNAFLQLKHYLQRIYLPYFQLLVHQIPYVIFETITHFSQQNSSIFFSSNITYFWQKHPFKVQIFRLSTARVKIHQILNVIFQTKSPLFFKVWITLSVINDNSSVTYQL